MRSAVGQRGFDSVPLVASATSPIDQTEIVMRIQRILVSLTFVAGVVRLNIAKSRVRLSIWSFVRIDQTCFARSGGFWPISLPLF